MKRKRGRPKSKKQLKMLKVRIDDATLGAFDDVLRQDENRSRLVRFLMMKEVMRRIRERKFLRRSAG